MTPRGLMWLGFATGILALGGELIGHSIVVLAWGGGCLFGKGYGIWEERSAARLREARAALKQAMEEKR